MKIKYEIQYACQDNTLDVEEVETVGIYPFNILRHTMETFEKEHPEFTPIEIREVERSPR